MPSAAPAASAVELARWLPATQGKTLLGAWLAIRAVTEGLTTAPVDCALIADRSLVLTWLSRGTLHRSPARTTNGCTGSHGPGRSSRSVAVASWPSPA